jgi:hypothetical protein
MSRYGIDYYGIGKYGNDNLTTFSATPFVAKPWYDITKGGYGVIKLTWTTPTGDWARIRLVRNSYGFPINAYDGTILINAINGSPEAAPVTYDSGLKQEAFYYYSIFVLETSTYTWIRAGNALSVSVKDYGTIDTIYNYLPDIYKITTPYIATTGSYNNNDLYNFLYVYAFQLDYARTLAQLATARYETGTVEGRLLTLLLKQFNITYEPEIGYQQSRSLARTAVQLYKEKGSNIGLQEFIKTYTGYGLPAGGPPTALLPRPSINGVTISHNLFLDYNDSSFEEGVGHWEPTTGSAVQAVKVASISKISVTSNVVTVTTKKAHGFKVNMKVNVSGSPFLIINTTYGGASPVSVASVPTTKTFTFALTTGNVKEIASEGIVTPYPTPWAEPTAPSTFPNKQIGVLAISNSTGSAATVSAWCGLSSPVTKGIPVTAGASYSFSVYTGAVNTLRAVQLSINWYTRKGVLISTSTNTATNNAIALYTSGSRKYLTVAAPATAAYAVPGLNVASVAASSAEFHMFDAAQFERLSYTVTGYYNINNTTTLLTNIKHSATTGQSVTVAGVSGVANGTYTVTGYTDYTILFALTASNSPAVGTTASISTTGVALASSGASVTFTTSSAHGLVVGQQIAVTSYDNILLNSGGTVVSSNGITGLNFSTTQATITAVTSTTFTVTSTQAYSAAYASKLTAYSFTNQPYAGTVTVLGLPLLLSSTGTVTISGPTDFDEARQIHITARANRINELTNPHFANSGAPWNVTSGNANAAIDTDSQEPNAETYNITSAAITSDVATITVDTYHIMRVNQNVVITGVNSTFNGQYTITAVTAYTFTYAKTASNTSVVPTGAKAHLAGNGLQITGTNNSAPVVVKSYATTADYMDIFYPQTDYTFSIYVQSPGAVVAITPKIVWYDVFKSVLEVTSGTTVSTTNDGAWTRISVTASAPLQTGYATVELSTSLPTATSTFTLDSAMFENSSFVLDYFDGSGGSGNTADFIWQGNATNAARSHYYKNAFAMQVRLINGALYDYLTLGTTASVYLAQPRT